jgi:uncharacterized protein YhaN
METWLRNHVQLRRLVQEEAKQAAAMSALAQQVARFEASARDAVGRDDQSFTALLAAAKTRVEQAAAVEHGRQSLLKSQRDLQTTARRLADDLAAHQRQEQGWQAEWSGFLRELGLPSEWPVPLAQKVIARLTTAREKLRNLPGLEARIEQMGKRLNEFAALFAEICRAAAQEPGDQLPEIGIARLHDSLTAALKSQERYASLQSTLEEKRGRLGEIDVELDDARTSRARFLKLALVENDDDFRQVAERARRIAELDVAITRQRRELDKDRENDDAAEFARLLAEADLDALREQARALEQELNQAETKAKSADERVGSCRQILLDLEKGGSQAATLQEQLAGKRARLAAAVDRYVPLLFAQQLLEQAIKKFEQESQPAMLQDVSSIFQSMTGGRYVRVQRSNEDDDSLLVRRADERLLEPQELSTGTREQLYLAIRLAYVLHYCGRAEPLPIVMDDVLANFDDDRALRTLRTLGDVASKVQVLMFTCHPHLAALAQSAVPGLEPISIGAAG